MHGLHGIRRISVWCLRLISLLTFLIAMRNPHVSADKILLTTLKVKMDVNGFLMDETRFVCADYDNDRHTARDGLWGVRSLQIFVT